MFQIKSCKTEETLEFLNEKKKKKIVFTWKLKLLKESQIKGSFWLAD